MVIIKYKMATQILVVQFSGTDFSGTCTTKICTTKSNTCHYCTTKIGPMVLWSNLINNDLKILRSLHVMGMVRIRFVSSLITFYSSPPEPNDDEEDNYSFNFILR